MSTCFPHTPTTDTVVMMHQDTITPVTEDTAQPIRDTVAPIHTALTAATAPKRPLPRVPLPVAPLEEKCAAAEEVLEEEAPVAEEEDAVVLTDDETVHHVFFSFFLCAFSLLRVVRTFPYLDLSLSHHRHHRQIHHPLSFAR